MIISRAPDTRFRAAVLCWSAMAAAQTGVGPDEAPVKPVLEVLVLYEDLSTALRAKHSLDRLADQLVAEVGFCVRWWRLDLLDASLLAEQAAIEAAAASVIILSLHGRNELRSEACGWLNRWLTHKADRPCALAALLDPDPAHPNGPPPVVARLKQFAEAARADLFCGSCPPPVAALGSARAGTRQRANPRSGREEPPPASVSPANAA